MKKNIRLPAHIKPLRYKLLIKPDLETFTFGGSESIALVLDKSTASITLHAKELSISDVMYQVAGSKYQAKKNQYDTKTETATFSFRKKLPKGKGELSLKFRGILNDKMRGFYRSHYYQQGVKKHLATTQFEATDARRAFPCFDEPHQKAIFDVTIMAPPGLTAISNTVESRIKNHESGYKVVEFVSTPKMSTYLVAFIVGEFEWIEGYAKTHPKADKSAHYNQKGILVRVFTTPGKKHQAKFALDCAVKTLEFYNQYFDLPYPLPVLDLIAIPDFSHGAMENWGAVTYRESALLVDPEHSSASNKQWVALVIAHELAHQWFGNLVTMRWWTDLWLNEGFASFIEYLAVDQLFPQWDIWTQFAYNDLDVALKLDALKSTHPIEITVHHPDEIGEIFDEVSYSKGASLIRMLADYLGERVFRDGLRYYLKRHKFKNAETKDLWQAFARVSKKPVGQIMENWTQQAGYPLLRVIDQPQGYKLVQSRYFSSPLSKKLAHDKTVWRIPIKVASSKNQASGTKFFLTLKTSKIDKSSAAWIKFNAGETSFIRVDYPAQLLAKLHRPVKNRQLAPLDRLGLIRDAFALAESGDLPTPQALELCQAYVDENDYTVWVEIINGFNSLDNLLYGQKCHPNFQKFVRGILKNIVNAVGWQIKKNEAHTRSLLRSLALNAAGSFGEADVIAHAQNLFGQWQNKNRPVNPDLRGVVYNLTAQNGGRWEQASLIKRYHQAALHEEKNRLGRALGQFKDSRLAAKTLEFALSKNVRSQDTAGIFTSAWANPAAKTRTWRFTQTHWRTLVERYPSPGHMLARFIKPAAYLVSKKQADAVKSFFKKHRAPGATRAVSQVLEKIYSNDAWLKRDLSKIENWLNDKA